MAEEKEREVHTEKLRVTHDVAKGNFVQHFSMACLSFDENPHFFLDGIAIPPPGTEPLLVARLIMTPETLKNLNQLISQVISDYEKEQGEIKVPNLNISYASKDKEMHISK